MGSIYTVPCKKRVVPSCLFLSEKPLKQNLWLASAINIPLFLLLLLLLPHPRFTSSPLSFLSLPHSTLHPQASINNSSTQAPRGIENGGPVNRRQSHTIGWLTLQHPASTNQITERRSYSDDWQEVCGQVKPGVMPLSATRGRCGMTVDARPVGTRHRL